MTNTSLAVQQPTRTATVALVGNPNTGKSTIFNALTGFRQRVGNYPGVTVERKSGMLRSPAPHVNVEVLDLPGTYSLAVHQDDEAIVLDVLLGRMGEHGPPDVIVSVIDAANLRRNLFLTTQILELDRPIVVALNMVDLADDVGIRIDAAALSVELGVPVVPVIATRQVGMKRLEQAILEALASPCTARQCQTFPDCVCAELDGLCHSISRLEQGALTPSSRVEVVQSLLAPGGFHEARLLQRCGLRFSEELADRRARIAAAGESVVEVEARVRYAWIDRVVQNVVTHPRPSRRLKSEIVDRFITHPVWGLMVLLILLATCFQAVYSWAQPVMDAIDGIFGALGGLIGRVLSEGPIQSLMVNGVIAGVGAVLTFLPQIVILFLLIALLEDCGYMARAAFLLDRWMRLLGLNGKSFIPLLSSFACAVPGIMATRTIESRRDRMLTILIAPLMSCSARLPVYVLLIGAFVPATPLVGKLLNLQTVTLLAMYGVGVAVAVPMAWLLKKTVLQGPVQSFLLELPTYKWPSIKTVFHRAYEQGREFCVSAGTIIFAVSVAIWALGYYPHSAAISADFQAQRESLEAAVGVTAQEFDDGDDSIRRLQERLSQLDREEAGAHLRNSVLGHMGRWIEPAVKPLGWDWRIGTAAIAAFPAREVVIATMGTIYNLGDDQDDASYGLRAKIKAAAWPDGRLVFDLAVALSLMVFFALCCQCGATLAVIKRETNSWRWPLLTFTYMTSLAYVGALITYQVASRLL